MKDIITQSHAPHITNDPFPARQGYKWTEVGVIPEDWEIQRLDAICSVYSGGTPSTARHDFYGGHIPWITSGDLNARRITEVSNYLTQVGFDSSAAKMVESGDLVVALYGATAGVVAITEIEAAINQAVLAIKTNRCDSEYLFHHLASRRNQIVATYTQGGQPNLSGDIIRSLVIVIPPLAEQRAIAKALSDVDGLLNALEALIAKKRAIKQAAMQQLLTGRTRLPGFSGEWETRRLQDVSDIDPENFSSNMAPDYKFNYISLEQVDSGKLLGYSEEVFRTAPSRARRILRNGDVLMSTVRPNLMAHLFFQNQISNAVCSTGFAVLRAKRDLSVPYFLFAQLFSKSVNDQITKILAGSNYPAINSRDVKLIEIPCPTQTSEQHTIASVLSDMDAEIAALEQRRDKTIAIKQGIMQQLLTGRVRLVKRNK